jgi:hypothetical protein
VSGDSHRTAIRLVFLQIANLAMVNRAIGRAAARGQVGGRKRFRQGGEPRKKQRQKRRDGCEFAPKATQVEYLPVRVYSQKTKSYNHRRQRRANRLTGGISVRLRICLAMPLPVLTHGAAPANMRGMAHSFLIFDFGANEDAAQQARHRIDGWKQGFRLDKKLQVKFDRKDPETKPAEASAPPKPAKSAAKGKQGAKAKSDGQSASKADSTAADPSKVRLIVRLDFSDHEKLSHQRWIDRIPVEEPFKDASPKIVRAGEPEFKTTSDLFDSLD